MTDAWRLHRRNDRETSVAAAEEVAPKVTERQSEVLAFAATCPNGFTDHEMMHALGTYGLSTHRTRRSELTVMGLIVDTGRTKLHAGHRTPHTVWALKPGPKQGDLFG